MVVVTFAVDGDTIYTAVDQKPKSGSTLKRLRNVGENPVVTMLADHYSDDWETLWWVRADGRAAILTDQRQMAAPLRLLANRYLQYRQAPPPGPVLAVTVERWTGWTGAPATGTQATGTRHRDAGDRDADDLSRRGRAAGGRAAWGQAVRALRKHWIFAALLLLGAALRGVVQAAYHPALIFPDSVRYLQYAHNFTAGQWSPDALRQSGYSVLIIPATLLHDLWLIPLAQHLAGLATAAGVYAVLIRFGARRWLAAAAAVPVLFDPLQLVLEQYVLADVWTVFLIMAALVLLVWRREGPGKLAAAACGLLLGVAVTFRDQDLIMIIPAALYVLVAVRPRRRMLTRLAALTGCFLIPVAGYLGWFDAAHGQPNFTTFSGAFLYGRVADFASCQGLDLPAYERPLCPAQPPAQPAAQPAQPPSRPSRPPSRRHCATRTSTPGTRSHRSGRSTPRPGCPGTRWCATSACGSCGTSRWPTPRRWPATSSTGSRRSAAPGRSSTRRRTCSSTRTFGRTGRPTPRSARSATRRRSCNRAWPPS